MMHTHTFTGTLLAAFVVAVCALGINALEVHLEDKGHLRMAQAVGIGGWVLLVVVFASAAALAY